MSFVIQQTRWDKLIRRVSGSIGPGSRVGVSISDLFPVLDVEHVPGELLVLSGTSLCHGAAGASGAVGELPNVLLFNPPESTTLITLTQISVASSIAQRIRIELSQSALGAQVLTERFREGRLITPTTLPVGQVRTFSNPSQLGQQAQFDVAANLSAFVSDENGLAIISPDTKYVVSGITTASTIEVAFWWRERPAEQSELNL